MDSMFKDEDLVRYGTMKKDPFDMTPKELKKWQKQVADNARTYLFSIGQPLVYEKDGQMVAEFADGRIEKI